MALQLSYLLSLLLLILLLPYSTTAQTSSNQSLGSSLTAQENGSYWASPSGDFAFGFQQIGTGGYLLAIWFNKLPNKTIVWSANGGNLVPGGSKVELTKDGKFVLNEIWEADIAGPGVAYAAMLDTGNFVLASQNSSLLWQSFNYPTDTMLPSQTLSLGSKLVARYSEMNYAEGRFQFQLESTGSLVLHSSAYRVDSNTDYWSGPDKLVGSGFQVVFNASGSMTVTARNGSIVTNILPIPDSTQDCYQRAIMEYDGVLRHYVYPKSSLKSGNWSSLPTFIPSNICIGNFSGVCGDNSYCKLDESKRPKCLCPDGYAYIDPKDVTKGCKQNFVSQSCYKAFPESDNFYFNKMPGADWPFSSDYGTLDDQNEDLCMIACLSDCLCAVAIYRERKCWMKTAPFWNGRVDDGDTGIALIKIRKDNSTWMLPGADVKKKDQSTVILIVSVLLGSSVFLNLLFLLAVFLLVFCFKYWKPKALKPYEVLPGMNLRSYTYEELTQATNGFKELLGRGGSAKVYKGFLEYEGRKPVAVKRIDDMGKEGDDMVEKGDLGFKAEVSAIGRTNHRNLVQLLGFCNEGQHRLLVYEFMSNGSLASFLFGVSRPNWDQRIEIALETARGLFYLHEECSTQIIHHDVKPQNNLLDDSFTARISDFGLTKILKLDQTRTTTGIRGTKGYVALGWFRYMPVIAKVDVYSFGILLLELICCTKSFEAEAQDEDRMILANWAYDCYKERKLDLLVENDEEAIDDVKRVENYVMIAIWCI
ncbi:G-type lectin S-receptor-like serine/threonine-protein kinase LECRK3 [Castanea sativa]|uniref:G-type lectin S-receptor-like serine/threonine-protein kinase LECRK3 n=1 Tax=Castanea sativa TaxID=21020 RepID=UPI003F64B094